MESYEALQFRARDDEQAFLDKHGYYDDVKGLDRDPKMG